MCFTVNVNLVKEELENRFGIGLLDPEKYTPSYYYHAFAHPELPSLFINEVGEQEMKPMKWGLIPSWVESAEEADKLRKMTANARSETISEKPSFADSFERRRCIIPVSGFYEWQHHPSGKRPWYIYRKDTQIMLLAGVFDIWRPQDRSSLNHDGDLYSDSVLSTFSILTTRANKLMSEIHNSKLRMPVIIKDEFIDRWLMKGNVDDGELMKPLDENYIKAHTVNPAIAKKSFSQNSPDTIKPYTYPEELTLF